MHRLKLKMINLTEFMILVQNLKVMKRLILLVITLSLFNCSRQKGNIESLFVKEIEDCKSKNCKIKLKDLTNFEWDTVYFFEVPITREFVNNSIGVNYNNYVEFTRPIIFLNKGEIIYSENNEASIESLVDEQILIGSITDTTKVSVFTPNEAIFNVKVKENNHLKYYELTPVNNNINAPH